VHPHVSINCVVLCHAICSQIYKWKHWISSLTSSDLKACLSLPLSMNITWVRARQHNYCRWESEAARCNVVHKTECCLPLMFFYEIKYSGGLLKKWNFSIWERIWNGKKVGVHAHPKYLWSGGTWLLMSFITILNCLWHNPTSNCRWRIMWKFMIINGTKVNGTTSIYCAHRSVILPFLN
jgi:hypothetical protein